MISVFGPLLPYTDIETLLIVQLCSFEVFVFCLINILAFIYIWYLYFRLLLCALSVYSFVFIYFKMFLFSCNLFFISVVTLFQYIILEPQLISFSFPKSSQKCFDSLGNNNFIYLYNILCIIIYNNCRDLLAGSLLHHHIFKLRSTKPDIHGMF